MCFFRPCARALRAILLGAGTILAACSGTPAALPAAAPEALPPPPATSLPVLSVPIVDLTLVNDFLPFGFSASPGRVNPTYELRTNGDTVPVRAAGPGVVVNIFFNPTEGDSEVHVRPPDAADYLVIYDHVTLLQVATGQSVTAGQVLGTVGPFVPRVGRTELQVNRTTGQTTLALCPRDFGTADFNAAHDAALARFPARGGSVCLAATVQP